MNIPTPRTDKHRSFLCKHGWNPFIDEPVCHLITEMDQLERELITAKREIRFLRAYGNKDCTAMADEAMANHETP